MTRVELFYAFYDSLDYKFSAQLKENNFTFS